MKFHNISVRTLSVVVVLSLLVACKKDHDGGTTPPPPPPPPPPPTLASMKVSLSYPAYYANFELIISEPGGKILLDTLPPYINNITATLKTNQTLLDLTLISYDSTAQQYNTITYKGIDPSKWTSVVTTRYSTGYSSDLDQNATIRYTNTLPSDFYIFLSDYVGNGNVTANYPTPGTVDVRYKQYASGNYLYLLFPQSGLYNFHIPKGLADTVELTGTDTAVKVYYNTPAQYTLSSVQVTGIMDTSDLSKSVLVWNYSHVAGWPNVEYPTKLVQKMEFFGYATSTNKETINYYSYGDTIPSSLLFPDQTTYTLSATQNTNFSVNFLTTHPSYYQTVWKSAGGTATFYASPDSAAINPVGFLTSLKSKQLQGKDLSKLALSTFGFELAHGMDCPAYFNYACNSVLVRSSKNPSVYNYSKTF